MSRTTAQHAASTPRMGIAVPGVAVRCSYRDCGGHVGTVLSLDDPRAWLRSMAFPGDAPAEPDAIAAHVGACLTGPAGFGSRVPVAWSFGVVYWEPIASLTPVSEGLRS